MKPITQATPGGSNSCKRIWPLVITGLVTFTGAGLLMAAAPEPSVAPPARLEIISLKPNKILYNDKEGGTATVLLANPLDQAQEVTLKPGVYWDLEESLILAPVKVTVPAKGNASAQIPLPAPDSRWGREIRVEAEVNGAVVDTGRQFYGVNSDWMNMILIAFPRHAYLDHGMNIDEEPFSTYTTVSHWFAWAAGDYTCNAPEFDEWWSGQTGYHMFKKDIQEAIKKNHEKGVHCTFYNNSFSDGKAGLEWARQHPEWATFDRNGVPMVNGSDIALAKPYSDKATGSMGQVILNFYDPKVIEWGAKNVIESIKMFGWDGMFWDCGGCALFPGFSYDGQPSPHGQDPDQISCRDHRMFREIVRKEFPYFGIWINGDINFYRLPFWSSFGNGGGIPTYEDQMSAPSSCMLAEFRGHESPGTTYNNWRRCYDGYAEQRDAVTQRFGTPVTAGYTAAYWSWPTENHLGALYLATQMHPCNCHQPGTWPATQFMTRYSALVWNRDSKIIKDAEKVFTVEKSRSVWWEKSAYRRPTPKGEDLMVHLVAAPETETVDIKRQEIPPATVCKVTLTVPDGKKVKSVWVLEPRQLPLDHGGAPAVMSVEPDGKTYAHKTGSLCRTGPSQIELKPVIKGNLATVELPPFIYYSLVVFRLEK